MDSDFTSEDVYFFNEIAEINPPRTIKRGTVTKYVSMEAVEPRRKHVSNIEYRKYEGGSRFKNNDILFARITPSLEHGKTCIVDFLEKGEIGAGSTEFIVISSKDGKTIPDYVYYLTISDLVREPAIISMTGTSGRQRVDTDIFASIIAPIPHIGEQKAIAKILSDLDAKIELNQKLNKTLEAIAQAIFKHWFIDFEYPNEEGKPYKSSGGEMVDSELGEIPKDWRVSNLGNELVTVLGGTPSKNIKDYWSNGNIPWINSGKVNEFRIMSPSAYITYKALENSSTKIMPRGTTVLAITGATLGKISRIETEMCANQSVVGIIGNELLPSEFVYFWIKNNIGLLISNQTGGAQQHINKENVNELHILVPNKEIMVNYVKIVKPMFDRIAISSYEEDCLSKVRDSLLPKLMSGKIRVPLEE